MHEMTSSFLALIGDIGGAELLLIFVLVLVLFGGKRLPEFARGLGKSIREFKKATSGVEEELRRVMEEPPPPPRKKSQTSLPAASTAALPSGSESQTGVITDEHAYDYDYGSEYASTDPYHPGPDAPSTASPETEGSAAIPPASTESTPAPDVSTPAPDPASPKAEDSGSPPPDKNQPSH